MKRLQMAAMAALMSLGLGAAGVAGVWKGSMETQMGKTETVITIQAGPELAGRVGIGQYEGALEKAKRGGDKISFEINIEHGRVGFEGTVAGDEMKLTVTGTSGNKYALSCRRQK